VLSFGLLRDVVVSGRSRRRVERESDGGSVFGQAILCRLYVYGAMRRPGIARAGQRSAVAEVRGGAGTPPIARFRELATRLAEFPACASGCKPLQFFPPCSAKRASASSWNPSAWIFALAK